MQSGQRPYAIRERVFQFAVDVLARRPRRQAAVDHAEANAWAQLTDAVTSAGANLEEAEAASSRPDFIARTRIALRELREAAYWLRLIDTARLWGADAVPPLTREVQELIAITTAIVRNASRNTQDRRR